MAEPIRIVIVDDHPFFKDGVARALRKERLVRLVGTGSTAAEAVSMVVALRPDVLLLDIGLPGGGLLAAKDIAGLNAGTKVIMLTASDDETHVTAALEAGAAGYLLKGIEAAELIEAVRTVHDGQPYITQSLSSKMLIRSSQAQVGAVATDDRCLHLSTRERQLLDHAANGLTNSDIATCMQVPLPTVKNTMSRIFDKLGVRNRAEAIAVFLKSQATRSSRGGNGRS